MISDKTTLTIALLAGLIFVGVIVYNFIDFTPTETVIVPKECPQCVETECNYEIPEVVEYPYPVEVEKIVNTTSTVEVIDEQCALDFRAYKDKFRSAIYNYCIKYPSDIDCDY